MGTLGVPRENLFLGNGSWQGWAGRVGVKRSTKREENWVCAKGLWGPQGMKEERVDR